MTVLDQIIVAIRAISDYKGASSQAIKKYLKSEFNVDNANLIKKNLKAGVQKKKLEQEGQRFYVAGDERLAVPEEDVVKIKDVDIGEGEEEVVTGSTVDVQYKGKLVSDGSVFDQAKSFIFTVGAGDVIKGWDQGLLGMKPKGTRKLVVPSKLGYGKKGSGPEIPPNSDLKFDIRLNRIL